MDTNVSAALDWLEQEHAAILGFERAAHAALEHGDTAGYAAHLREKGERLAALARKAQPHLTPLPAPLRERITERLFAFSESAATGLSLNSLFYLNSLLYRDDHGVDEPDNLLVFLTELRQSLSEPA